MTYRERLYAGDPLHVATGEAADIRFHDGGLRHARGVKNYQVLRACRDKRYAADGCGWTYNHAPMLAWWRGRFFVEYLANPRTEHQPPSQTFLVHSPDGRHWSAPQVVFPPLEVAAAPYRGPGKELLGERVVCNCHQRMGFYVSGNGRLLVSAFYGISPEIHIGPNNGWGVGRVVREVRPDLTLSPIYFLRWNEPAGFTRENTPAFPAYEDSPDAGFVAACREFLADRLAVQQWWEEQRFDGELFTVPGGAALCTYTRPDGEVIGVYKMGLVIRSRDGGATWSEKRPAYSLETNTGKVWGQRLDDGRYALIYNPSRDSAHRWPLAATVGEDGEHFSGLLALTPEISPCRYEGGLKNLGAQYVRGIAERNPRPGDGRLRLTYSVNKEDIWVLEAPLPLTGQETGPVCADFAAEDAVRELENWNLYVPMWCGAELAVWRDRRALVLCDRDPYDRPRAERLLPPGERLRAGLALEAGSLREGTAMIVSFEDGRGREAIRLRFDADGVLRLKQGGSLREWRSYAPGPLTVEVELDCVKGETSVCFSQAGERDRWTFAFNQPLTAVERAVFSTKDVLPWNTLEDQGRGGTLCDLPNDHPAEESRFAIDRFFAEALE